MSILIPTALIDNNDRYWQVSDAYNNGNVMTHFQVMLNTSSYTPYLYYGASQVSDASYNIYYQ